MNPPPISRPRGAVWLIAGALAVLLGIAPSEAATRFRFSSDPGVDGTIWRDGARCRVERQGAADSTAGQKREPGGMAGYDVILDENGRRLYLDTAGRIWWEASEHPHPLDHWENLQGMPAGVPITASTRIAEPSVELIEDAYAEPVAGLPTRKFVIRFRYVSELEYPAEVVRVITAGTWMLWATRELEEGPCVIDPGGYRTEVPEIDARIEAKLAEIPGVLVQRQLAITSRIEGGASQTLVELLTIDEIEPANVPDSRFELPDGYRHEPPRFALPGAIDPRRSGASLDGR